MKSGVGGQMELIGKSGQMLSAFLKSSWNQVRTFVRKWQGSCLIYSRSACRVLWMASG